MSQRDARAQKLVPGQLPSEGNAGLVTGNQWSGWMGEASVWWQVWSSEYCQHGPDDTLGRFLASSPKPRKPKSRVCIRSINTPTLFFLPEYQANRLTPHSWAPHPKSPGL